MKRRFLVAFLGFTAMLALAVASYAGDVMIKFTNPKSAPHNTYGGFYVGIYLGTVNGVQTEFVCDDFLHDITLGQQWSAVPGSTNPVTGGVEFGPLPLGVPITNPALLSSDLTQQQEYNMITYLADQIFADQDNSHGNWGYLSWAIWSITDHAWDNSTYYTAPVQYDVAQALAHDNNNGDLNVFTPDPNTAGQEFLSTPEASSVLLLGIFLAAGAALLLTKKKLATPELLGDC
ncbi:MAG TPA: hypothetical protein VMX16_10745 [Terriglobia bacterium]|nr:hypothetical protein [Terriglobia bacterium]